MINSFLDKNESVRPTLALEYSYARRTNSSGQSAQKLIGNIWELGSLANSSQLIDVPIKSHGLSFFSAVIMLNLSEPAELTTDLESALQGLKLSFSNNYSDSEIKHYKKNILRAGSSNEQYGANTSEVMPCATVVVGGMYDKFENFDPEVKKHVVRFLRCISHTLGASLVFYSTKFPSLSKTVNDIMTNLSFASCQNSISMYKTDYNEPILISQLSDSWEKIGVLPINLERIAITYSSKIQQNKSKWKKEITDLTKDSNFCEPVIDDLRAIKDEEIIRLIKNSEIKLKFDSFNLTTSPFNYPTN